MTGMGWPTNEMKLEGLLGEEKDGVSKKMKEAEREYGNYWFLSHAAWIFVRRNAKD